MRHLQDRIHPLFSTSLENVLNVEALQLSGGLALIQLEFKTIDELSESKEWALYFVHFLGNSVCGICSIVIDPVLLGMKLSSFMHACEVNWKLL